MEMGQLAKKIGVEREMDGLQTILPRMGLIG
jgi:hypothetical protein